MVIAVERWRVAYAAVPKAGCSSVKAMLAGIDPRVTRPPEETATDPGFHRIYQTCRFRPHNWAVCADHFKFTVIRDPLQRLLSVFTDRVEKRGDLNNSRRLRRGVVALSQTPDAEEFFANLRGYMRAASIIKHHCLPTWLFTGKSLAHYDAVYQTAQMSALADRLGAIAGQPVAAARVNRSRTSLDFHDLSRSTRGDMLDFLADDYRYLAEHFAPPPLDREGWAPATTLRRSA